MTIRRQSSRTSFYAVTILCCVFLTVLCYPLWYQQMLIEVSDLHLHSKDAESFFHSNFSSWFQLIGHPLWHACTVVFRILGLPFEHAGIIVTLLMKIAQFLIINSFFCNQLKTFRNQAWIPVLSLLTVIVSAIRISTINPQVYLNAGTPNTWHSPTQIALMFWMLLSFFYLSTSYDHQLNTVGRECLLPWTHSMINSFLLFMTALAKPVFILCFFPGAAIYFLFQWIKHPSYTRYYIRLLFSLIPTILLILIQFNVYYGHESNTGFSFILNWANVSSTFQAALLTNAFPFAVLLQSHNKCKSCRTPISLCTYACACLINAFLCETGFRADHGNFGWAMLGSSMLLWVIAIPQYVEMVLENRTRSGKWINTACGALLAWHFFSGIYYIYYLFTSGKWY